MKGQKQPKKVRYATESIEFDAGARGWSKAELIRQAQAVAKRRGATVPDISSFYLFLTGATVSPNLAGLLAEALNEPLTNYLIAPPRRRTIAA